MLIIPVTLDDFQKVLGIFVRILSVQACPRFLLFETAVLTVTGVVATLSLLLLTTTSHSPSIPLPYVGTDL
jgi:hypothetical protein